MSEWIKGQGFYLVQPTKVYTKAELAAQLDKLKQKIKEAEAYHAAQKEWKA